MTDESARVVLNKDKDRYEVLLGEKLAGFSGFTQQGDTVVFTHTEVDGAFAGKGLGKALAAGALDDVVARGLTIVPVCPFITAYVRKHDEYNDHVTWPR